MLNHAELIGRLGKDPEIKQTSDGKKVANLSVATWDSYWNGTEWITTTEWHRVVLWGDAAEWIDRQKKGDMVYVSGKIKTRKYTDTASGTEKYTTEIHGICKAIPKGTTEQPAQIETSKTPVPPVQSNTPGNPSEGTDLPF